MQLEICQIRMARTAPASRYVKMMFLVEQCSVRKFTTCRMHSHWHSLRLNHALDACNAMSVVQAIFQALEEVKTQHWFQNTVVFLYRGAWQVQ